MPSSYHGFISDIISIYMQHKRKTVLDVGCGFGKWGHLFREYGDVFMGRPDKADWQTRIIGVEAHEPYIGPHHRHVYDDIIIGDIAKIAPGLPNFDFGYAGDVIEHLDKGAALSVIKELRRKCGTLVVCIPLGMDWPQGEAFGNIHEEHRSTWTRFDFDDWPTKKILTNPNGKEIGLFSC